MSLSNYFVSLVRLMLNGLCSNTRCQNFITHGYIACPEMVIVHRAMHIHVQDTDELLTDIYTRTYYKLILQQSQTKTCPNTSLLHNATNSMTFNHDYVGF
jgi:hypothetical protein